MNEGRDTHYQPWLRDTDAPDHSTREEMSAPSPVHERRSETPQDKPPIGIDLGRYVREHTAPGRIGGDRLDEGGIGEDRFGDDYVRPLPTSATEESWGALAAKSSRKLFTSIKNGWNGFAGWTIALGEQADIPARVASMKLDEKARIAAAAVSDASKTAASKTAELSRSAAARTAESAKQLSHKTVEGVARLELGEKIGDVAEKAGETLKKGANSVVDVTKAASETVADVTKAGVESVVDATKSGVETVSRAGADLTRKPVTDAAAIPSALEQLLAEEAAAEAPATLFDAPPVAAAPAPPPVVKPAPTLPLFAEVPETVPAQPSPKKARPSYRDLALERGGGTEETPVAAPAPPTTAEPPSAGAETAQVQSPSPLASRMNGWRNAAREHFTKSKDGIAPSTPQITASDSEPSSPATGAGLPSALLYAIGGTLLIGAAMWGISGHVPPRGLNQPIETGSTPPLAAAGIERSDRAEIEAIVHDYILNHPEIIPQAMERYQAKEIAQRVSGLRTEIETPFSGAWTGAADGDVTLVEFSDFACGFCRRSVDDIQRLLKNDKKLKIVFRELPILSDQSVVAAKTGLAAAKQGKYMAYYNAQFMSGPPSDDNIKAAAARAGLDAEATQKALLNGDIQAELDKNMNLARQLGFSGTPTWIVGDKVLQGAVGYEELKKAVDEARAAK